jgi:hypothetical protein
MSEIKLTEEERREYVRRVDEAVADLNNGEMLRVIGIFLTDRIYDCKPEGRLVIAAGFASHLISVTLNMGARDD